MAKNKKDAIDSITETANATKPAEDAQVHQFPPLSDLGAEWDFSSWEYGSASIWRPEGPGAAIIGVYHDFITLPPEQTDFDQEVNAHRILDAHTGAMISFIGGMMVDKNIAENGIEKGDKIFVQFRGQNDTRKGHRVNDYVIRFKKS